MHQPTQSLIARSSDVDELRETYLSHSENGVSIMQCSRGESTKLVFGEEAACHKLSLGAEALERLSAHLGWSEDVRTELERFFNGQHQLLSDLLDICDSSSIPYTFYALGSQSGAFARRGASEA